MHLKAAPCWKVHKRFTILAEADQFYLLLARGRSEHLEHVLGANKSLHQNKQS
jgi:hypothetical protein